MNKFYLSLDISTSKVGVALWDSSNGSLVELKHLVLNLKKDIDVEYRDLLKQDLFVDYFIKYKDYIKEEYNGDVVKVIVEAALPNTTININTTALLLGFNGMCRYELYKIFGIKPIKLNISEIRTLFCREFVKTKKEKGVLREVLSFPKGWKSDEKKKYIWERVSKLEPNIEWDKDRNGNPKDYCYDISDAYACGYAQLKKDGIL